MLFCISSRCSRTAPMQAFVEESGELWEGASRCFGEWVWRCICKHSPAWCLLPWHPTPSKTHCPRKMGLKKEGRKNELLDLMQGVFTTSKATGLWTSADLILHRLHFPLVINITQTRDFIWENKNVQEFLLKKTNHFLSYLGITAIHSCPLLHLRVLQ